MKKSKISNLTELQEEKHRLRLMTQVTKREMSHSLGFMRSETKKIALSNIAIPLGASAAAGMLLSKLNNNLNTKIKSSNSGITTVVTALIPFAMKFLESQKQQTKFKSQTH